MTLNEAHNSQDILMFVCKKTQKDFHYNYKSAFQSFLLTSWFTLVDGDVQVDKLRLRIIILRSNMTHPVGNCHSATVTATHWEGLPWDWKIQFIQLILNNLKQLQNRFVNLPNSRNRIWLNRVENAKVVIIYFINAIFFGAILPFLRWNLVNHN